MTDLHTLAGTTSDASRINEAGTVIGTYSPSRDVPGGFVSDGTTTSDLGTLGGGTTSPYDLNEFGVARRNVRRPGLPVCRRVDDERRPSWHDLERCHRHQ